MIAALSPACGNAEGNADSVEKITARNDPALTTELRRAAQALLDTGKFDVVGSSTFEGEYSSELSGVVQTPTRQKLTLRLDFPGSESDQNNTHYYVGPNWYVQPAGDTTSTQGVSDGSYEDVGPVPWLRAMSQSASGIQLTPAGEIEFTVATATVDSALKQTAGTFQSVTGRARLVAGLLTSLRIDAVVKKGGVTKNTSLAFDFANIGLAPDFVVPPSGFGSLPGNTPVVPHSTTTAPS